MRKWKMIKGPLPIRTTTSGIRERRLPFPASIGVELNIYDLVFHRGKAGVDSVFEIRRVCLISRLERRSSLCTDSTRIPISSARVGPRNGNAGRSRWHVAFDVPINKLRGRGRSGDE